MKPIRHQLQEGAIGDVIPHELLNRGKGYVNDAIAHVRRDHADRPGRFTHDDIRFATASACIDIMMLQNAARLGEIPIWADGFKVAPRFVSYTERDYRYIDLKWEMYSELPQIVTVGLATRGTAPFHPPPAGNTYAWGYSRSDNDKPTEGRVRVLRFHRDPDGDYFVDPSDYYACFARIYLMVRQPL